MHYNCAVIHSCRSNTGHLFNVAWLCCTHLSQSWMLKSTASTVLSCEKRQKSACVLSLFVFPSYKQKWTSLHLITHVWKSCLSTVCPHISAGEHCCNVSLQLLQINSLYLFVGYNFVQAANFWLCGVSVSLRNIPRHITVHLKIQKFPHI